jgi:hypothetical protein
LQIRAAGLSIVQQSGARVHCRNTVIGEYFLDLLVEGVFLKAIGRHPCLLLNFGK